MSIEQPNPFSSPVSVVHGKSTGSRAVGLAFAVSTLTTVGMFVAQLIARPHLASYGVEMPFETQMALNPIFVCLSLLGLPFVLASQSWASNWRRISVCAMSILFAICCAVFFGLSIYLPIEALRQGMGL